MKSWQSVLILVLFISFSAHAADHTLLNQLPDRLTAARRASTPGWESGVTVEMAEAYAKYNEELEKMLKEVVKAYYPEHMISQKDAAEYVEALYRVHGFEQAAECAPGELLGTIAPIELAGMVSERLEKTIAGMVEAITAEDAKFDFKKWKAQWKKAANGGR